MKFTLLSLLLVLISMNCVAMDKQIAYEEYANKIIVHKLMQNETGVYLDYVYRSKSILNVI